MLWSDQWLSLISLLSGKLGYRYCLLHRGTIPLLSKYYHKLKDIRKHWWILHGDGMIIDRHCYVLIKFTFLCIHVSCLSILENTPKYFIQSESLSCHQPLLFASTALQSTVFPGFFSSILSNNDVIWWWVHCLGIYGSFTPHRSLH